MRQHRDLQLAIRGPGHAVGPEGARQRFEVWRLERVGGRITYIDDALGELVHGPLVISTIILQLYDPVEAFGAITLTERGIIELEGLRNVWNPGWIHPSPQRWHDGINDHVPSRPAGNFPARESKPFLAAILAFKITPRIERDEDPAPLQGADQLGRPLGAELVFPVHKTGFAGANLRQL